MVDSVSIAKLVVYIILVQPALFCLWKHGKTGFLGWFYVQIFCILRIVTAAITLHGNQKGVGAVVLNSIGLSPLLLAVAGVLHEARRATNSRLKRRVELFLDIKYHTLVGTGMVLIIVAIVNLMQKSSSVSTMKTLLDVGSAISCICWALLALWAVQSLLATEDREAAAETFRRGRILLYAVFVALLLVALRLGYAVAYLQLRVSKPSSGFLTSTAVQVCLSLVPEMVCIAVLLLAGVQTSDLRPILKQRDNARPGNEYYLVRTK